MKIIAYIFAAILIFFGVLFVWGAGGNQGGGWTWVCGGALSVLFGFGLIWFVSRKPASAAENITNVTLKVDLPAQTKIESINCKSCGGALKADNIKMLAGAPTVECPYCGTTYQMTEEPKW
jgi:DNA-directed RNA polymerase subunit RPC12/RpoP